MIIPRAPVSISLLVRFTQNHSGQQGALPSGEVEHRTFDLFFQRLVLGLAALGVADVIMLLDLSLSASATVTKHKQDVGRRAAAPIKFSVLFDGG